jgi:hypothetical protein
LNKLSPEERAAFVKMLQEQAAARGVKLPQEIRTEPTGLGFGLIEPTGSREATCETPPVSGVPRPVDYEIEFLTPDVAYRYDRPLTASAVVGRDVMRLSGITAIPPALDKWRS